MEPRRTAMGEELDNTIPALISYDYPGLLGVESATQYWGLTSFYSRPPILLFEDNSQDYNGYSWDYAINFLFVPNVNYENTIHLSEHLLVTDREQTVCDMIRYNRHTFHLYEAVLSAYEDGRVDIKRLEWLAEEYRILDKLHASYSEAMEAYEADNA